MKYADTKTQQLDKSLTSIIELTNYKQGTAMIFQLFLNIFSELERRNQDLMHQNQSLQTKIEELTSKVKGFDADIIVKENEKQLFHNIIVDFRAKVQLLEGCKVITLIYATIVRKIRNRCTNSSTHGIRFASCWKFTIVVQGQQTGNRNPFLKH